MGLGGAVGVSAAANVFVGMVEAPLVIAPYLARLSRGELFIVMNCGMATIAGTVLVLYASFLGPVVPNALGHLLVASIVATPVAIAVAAVLVPPQLTDASAVTFERQDANTMAAITRGTLEGLQLLLNIVAMLVVFVALVALANGVLGSLPAVSGAPLTLERLFGWIFAPLAWLVGVPATEALTAGKLLGQKTVLNEFIAYIEMAKMGPDELSPRSRAADDLRARRLRQLRQPRDHAWRPGRAAASRAPRATRHARPEIDPRRVAVHLHHRRAGGVAHVTPVVAAGAARPSAAVGRPRPCRRSLSSMPIRSPWSSFRRR